MRLCCCGCSVCNAQREPLPYIGALQRHYGLCSGREKIGGRTFGGLFLLRREVILLTTAQIERVMELFFFGFLCFGAWKDLRTRQIFPGFLIFLGLTGILARAVFCRISWAEQGNWTECAMDWAAALGVGGLLLALSRLTGGSIGAGTDGFLWHRRPG